MVFAGLVVPGNDPLTMLALAVALCLLYEIAVQVSRFHDKRKAKCLGIEGLGDLDDEEASPSPVTAGVASIGASADGSSNAFIAAPEPIAPSSAPGASPAPLPPTGVDRGGTHWRWDPDAT